MVKLELAKIISKANLEDLYLNKRLSDYQIGKIFDVSGGRIHRLRNRYNIKAIEYYKRHHKQELDQREKEFLIGVLLGDAHIKKPTGKKAYPQLMFEQSTKHVEYAFWLKNQIKNWLFNPEKPLKQTRKVHKKTGKVYHSYPFQTIAHPVFIEFSNAFYEHRKKIISIDFIEQYFTLFSLAIWLMDDGTVSKNRNIVLCSHNFTKKENEILSSFLFKNFNLSSHIWKNRHRWHLAFPKKDSIKLTNLVEEYVIPSMRYKLISSETTKEAGE